MLPNINANPRGRKFTNRGRKPLFNADLFKERFDTIERVFGWEDKFRRLLLRFERLSRLHYAFKTLAYINQSISRVTFRQHIEGRAFGRRSISSSGSFGGS